MTVNSVALSPFATAHLRFVLLGATGALSRRVIDSVCSLHHCDNVSASDLLSREIAGKTTLGNAAARRRAAGLPVPDETLLAIMRRWFWGRRANRGFGLTGFPTTVAQAMVFDQWLDERDESLTACLWLDESGTSTATSKASDSTLGRTLSRARIAVHGGVGIVWRCCADRSVGPDPRVGGRAMIPIKTAAEIERMRDACRVAANVLEAMKSQVREGISTYELDQLARSLMLEEGATSACFQYQVGSRRFPSHTCISVNEEVVHGIASLKRLLRHGDIVALDVTVVYHGYIGDNACTVRVGDVSSEIDRLVRVTQEAMYEGIAQARAGQRVGDISHAVQRYVESRGYSVVREFVGHGVGRSMHEEPQIPNFGRRGSGDKLKPGMTLAIEPMVNLGRHEVDVLADGWTVVARDRKPSAHFEHTVLVTTGDSEILTVPASHPVRSS